MRQAKGFALIDLLFTCGLIGVLAIISCPRGESSIARLRSVTNTPGATALTRTPRGAHPTASARVNPATPDLLAV